MSGMLQVEKKRPGRKKRILLCAAAAAVLLAALLLPALFLPRREPVQIPERTETGGVLSEREPEEIQRIRIRIRGLEAWEAERNPEGEMVMTGEDSWPLDPVLGERIEDALARLVYEDILAEKEEEYRDRLAEFGLEEPELTAEVRYTDGETMTLRIGNDSGIEGMDFRYMTVDGDPRLYAAAGSLMQDLRVEREMLHRVPQPEIQTGRIDRISVLDGAGNPTAEWELRGEITDPAAAAGWYVSVPADYPADQERVSALKKSAGSLRLGIYVGAGTGPMLTECGLEPPQAEIRIHLAAGDVGTVAEDGSYQVRHMDEETVSFLIGGARSEMTDYCLYQGEIYTLNHFSAAALTELDPMETLADYPVTVPLENLRSLEIVQNGKTDRYTLTWTGGSEEESSQQFACRKNGLETEPAAFAAAYQRWLVVSFSGRLPGGWTPGEPHTVYRFETLSGQVHTVALSKFDAMHDAVTVDGGTLFYLIRGGLGEMP